MTTIRVANTADERLRLFLDLTNHQLRNALDPERGVVIVESEIAIRVAISRGVVPLAFLLSENKLASMADALTEVDADVPVYVLPAKEAEAITGYAVTRGALAAMVRPRPMPIPELMTRARRLVVLEGITDTANVGSIFRCAAALGADGIVVAPTCADPLARRAVRVSMGNVFNISWARAERPWPGTFMDELSAAGFRTLALALEEGARPIQDLAPGADERLALFFGSEGAGLTRKVISGCDETVVIPMAAGVDSLNVAASAAVALWELFGRSRRP